MTSPPPLRPERIRAVVFDLDGTLVDSYPAIASSLNRAREAFSLPPLGVDEVRRHVGRGLDNLVAELVGPTRVREAVAIFREHYGKVFAGGTTRLEGSLETLRELHGRGFALAVASNKPALFSRAILESLALLPFLVDVQGPDTAGCTKPDPGMIRACMSKMGVAPEETVYVGDMALDVESASRAGVAVVLVPGGSSDTARLRHTGERVLGSLAELVAILPEGVAPRVAPSPAPDSGRVKRTK